MPFLLEHAKHHVPRFVLEQSLVAVAPEDRGTMGRVWGMCGHWFGSHYTAKGHTYHFAILFNEESKTATICQRIRLKDKGSHLWRRNTGNVAVSLAAMGDIRDKYKRKIGVYKPQDVQLYAQAYAFACLAGVLGLNLEGTVTQPHYRHDRYASNGRGALYPTGRTIQAPVLADHAWYARPDNDDYAEHRWDQGTTFGPVKEMAINFRKWISRGDIPNRFAGWVK